MDRGLIINFVIPNGTDINNCSDNILLAYKGCIEQEIKSEWLEEHECLNVQPSKKDIYVFEKFEGIAFEHLKKINKILIIGTRCLMNCLLEGIEIPEVDSPVFTNALRGIIFSTTSFPKEKKEEIIQKCRYMGAFYSSSLRSSVTHLIAHRVLSNKYEMAVKSGVNIMTEEWVDRVWNESLKRNIHGNDPEYIIFKCPIFYNLVFTSSYLKKEQKESLKKLIENNGGTLAAILEKGKTNIVLLNESRGDKLRYASQWNIPCLKTAWINDSIKEGYALNLDQYNTQIKATISTPKMDTTHEQEPNFSISTIIETDKNHINDTNASSCCTSSMKQQYNQMPPPEIPKPSIKKDKVNVKEILRNINLREVKKIGSFLDGCKVYILGFIAEHNEKLRKILNHGGATRFNDLTSSVTHVLVDIERLKRSEENLLKQLLHRPHIVSVEWLAESVKLQHPAVEDDYDIYGSLSSSPTSSSSSSCHRENSEEIFNPCEASPLSKKGHKLLQSQDSRDEQINLNFSESSSKRVNRKLIDQLNFVETSNAVSYEETDLSKIYGLREENNSSVTTQIWNLQLKTPIDTKKDQSFKRNLTHSTLDKDSTTNEENISNIFENFTFVLIGINFSFESELERVISISGGKIVTSDYTEIIDYAVLPLELCEVRPTVKNIVNFFWVENCFDMQSVVDVEYYHKPIEISEDKPLSDCVLAITSFMGKERQFIIDLSFFLGAYPTEQFARNDVPKKNVRKATHLISKDKSSQKFQAALKWGVPVVTYKWLIACAQNNKRMSESQYGLDHLDETVSQNNEPLHNTVVIPNGNLATSPPKQENSNSSSVSTHSHGSNENHISTKISIHEVEATTPQNQSEESSSPKGITDQSPKKFPENDKINTLDKDIIVNKHFSRLIVENTSKTPSSSSSNRNKRKYSENENDSNNLPRYNQRIYGSDEESPIPIPRLSSIKKSYEQFTNKKMIESPSIGFKNKVVESSKTPTTPYGQFLFPNPSPDTRKRFKRHIDQIPSIPTDLASNINSTPNNKRRLSTPISQLKKKIWTKFGPDWKNWTDENNISQNQDIQNEENKEDYDKESEELKSENLKSPNKKNGKNIAQPGLSTQSQEVFNQIVHLNDILTTPSTKQDSMNHRLKRSKIDEEMSSSSNDGNFLMPESEPQVPITWEDPASNDLILKIKNRTIERQSLTKVNIQLYKFSISGDKALSEIVLTLGGSVSESSSFDNSISHMVVRSINRTERIMAAIASGKWLLHPFYLMASKDANKFLDEELYEWGNPKNKENEKLDGSSLSVARAAYRWRSHLNFTNETGAFSGMRAFVNTSKTRVESFQRLIMAGGGEIIKATSPSSNNLPGITHYFVEMKYVKESTIPFALMANKKIPCLNPSYLSNLLIQNPSPKIEDHYVEEYKNFIRSKS